ncbi:mRNA turnover protein 4 [Sarcoptes scabiei]|uniref:Uncharacterized protein n=1 Tax=Sarcoptes scabiei TaxID=52283 RepID=A0A132AIW1_SARSC|nr:hypothetical protein QR98_0095130 [Sarcoptes scabiei]UXI21248.1 mRNA turnover protein 4 [Sarcoptes scabiei]
MELQSALDDESNDCWRCFTRRFDDDVQDINGDDGQRGWVSFEWHQNFTSLFIIESGIGIKEIKS